MFKGKKQMFSRVKKKKKKNLKGKLTPASGEASQKLDKEEQWGNLKLS